MEYHQVVDHCETLFVSTKPMNHSSRTVQRLCTTSTEALYYQYKDFVLVVQTLCIFLYSFLYPFQTYRLSWQNH